MFNSCRSTYSFRETKISIKFIRSCHYVNLLRKFSLYDLALINIFISYGTFLRVITWQNHIHVHSPKLSYIQNKVCSIFASFRVFYQVFAKNIEVINCSFYLDKIVTFCIFDSWVVLVVFATLAWIIITWPFL